MNQKQIEMGKSEIEREHKLELECMGRKNTHTHTQNPLETKTFCHISRALKPNRNSLFFFGF